MTKLISILLCLTSLCASAQMTCGKQIQEQDVAFQSGEELSYNVKYSASFISTSVADVHMRVDDDINSFRITAVGKTRPFYSIFFEMEDTYRSWLDRTTLRPVKMDSKIREGGYKYQNSFTYNWNDSTVKTVGKNLKNGNSYSKTMGLTPCSFDALSLFYNLRCVDIKSMVPTVRYTLNLVLEDTVRTIKYRVIGREVRTINKVGRFRTIKVACQIATASGDALKDGSEFYIWLSDDRNHIPIYMESPIRVGSIKVFLTSWANLKHQFSSVVVQ